MKCIVMILVFITCLYQIDFAQTPYYDAQVLKNRPEGIPIILTNEVQELLVKYYPGKKTTDITTVLLEKNPFFKDLFENKGSDAVGDIPIDKSMKSFSISSIGGLNGTNFADGLAKFLVKRFKEELTITFFQKFKDAIDSSIELKTLFPQTYSVLRVIDKDIYQFSAYLNTIREAFIKDLTSLYSNFKKFKDIRRYKNYFDVHPELYTILVNALYFIDSYAAGVHAGEAFAKYDTGNLRFSNIPLQHNMQNAVALGQAFSNSFRSSSPDHYWVPADSIGRFFTDTISWDMYFGLMYQKYGAISFDVQNHLQFVRFDSLLARGKRIADSLRPYKAFVETFTSQFQEVNEYFTELKEKKKEDIDYNDYYKLYNASLDLLEHGFSFIDLPYVELNPALETGIRSESGRWIYVARTTADLYIDVRTKNYSSAVLNTCSIIDTVFLNCTDKVKTGILKYGTFAAAIATAKTSDEVAAAIESIALPSGSARVKRESPVNISLNGYVGGIGGWEYMPALKEKQTSMTAGIAAQVGVAFSIGNLFKGSNKSTGGKSLTLFVPVIDVGALASFRLQDDSSKVSSEVQLKNIFSPGLFVYFGFGKCPISIGAGAQIGPQLREVTAKNNNIEKNYYIRYGLSVCVDIPILNFYTKPKK